MQGMWPIMTWNTLWVSRRSLANFNHNVRQSHTALYDAGWQQWRTEGGFGVFKPPPEIPKALQNHAKFKTRFVKIVKNC